jgi:hypothetical protein
MSTNFLSDSLVKLPRFTVLELIALMQQLLQESEPALKTWVISGRKVPDFISKSLARVRHTKELLEASQPHEAAPQELIEQRRGDRKMDDAWKAFESFLKAWSLLDDNKKPGQGEAQRIYDLVIRDGIGFITLPFELEWQETKKRIEVVDTQNLLPLIEALGGGRFWAQLKRSFLEYGEVLQIKEGKEQDNSGLRPLWENAYNAVRHYFAKVIALEDPEDSGTQDIVRRLLKPIIEWQQKNAHNSGLYRIPTPVLVLQKDADADPTGSTLKMKVVEEPKK